MFGIRPTGESPSFLPVSGYSDLIVPQVSVICVFTSLVYDLPL